MGMQRCCEDEVEHHLLAAVILSDCSLVRVPHQSPTSSVAHHQGEVGLRVQVTERAKAPPKLEFKKKKQQPNQKDL